MRGGASVLRCSLSGSFQINQKKFLKGDVMLLGLFYIFAIACIILYYTGHLKRWRAEWVLIVLAIAVFPAVLFL